MGISRRAGFHSGQIYGQRLNISGEQVVGVNSAGQNDVTATERDHIIGVDTSDGSSHTVTIPDSLKKKGFTLVIVDEGGSAGTDAINVNVSCNVDGSDASSGTSLVSTNYGSAGLYFNGSNFFTF